jgi:hypothetical protein
VRNGIHSYVVDQKLIRRNPKQRRHLFIDGFDLQVHLRRHRFCIAGGDRENRRLTGITHKKDAFGSERQL